MSALSRRSILVLAAALLASCRDQGKADEPARALTAPVLDVLTLTTLAGRPEPLSAYRGRAVILNVWATWCAPCRAELPALQRMAEALEPAGVAVLGLAIDSNPVLVREYLRSAAIRFARHIDRDQRLSRDVLGAVTLPQTLIYDRDGGPRWRVEGVRAWDLPEMLQWGRNFAAAAAVTGPP